MRIARIKKILTILAIVIASFFVMQVSANTPSNSIHCVNKDNIKKDGYVATLTADGLDCKQLQTTTETPQQTTKAFSFAQFSAPSNHYIYETKLHRTPPLSPFSVERYPTPQYGANQQGFKATFNKRTTLSFKAITTGGDCPSTAVSSAQNRNRNKGALLNLYFFSAQFSFCIWEKTANGSTLIYQYTQAGGDKTFSENNDTKTRAFGSVTTLPTCQTGQILSHNKNCIKFIKSFPTCTNGQILKYNTSSASGFSCHTIQATESNKNPLPTGICFDRSICTDDKFIAGENDYLCHLIGNDTNNLNINDCPTNTNMTTTPSTSTSNNQLKIYLEQRKTTDCPSFFRNTGVRFPTPEKKHICLDVIARDNKDNTTMKWWAVGKNESCGTTVPSTANSYTEGDMKSFYNETVCKTGSYKGGSFGSAAGWSCDTYYTNYSDKKICFSTKDSNSSLKIIATESINTKNSSNNSSAAPNDIGDSIRNKIASLTPTLTRQTSSPTTDTTPTFKVKTVYGEGRVRLYSNSSCTTAVSGDVIVDSFQNQTSFVNGKYETTITTNSLSRNRTHTIYARQIDPINQLSPCSEGASVYIFTPTTPTSPSTPNPGENINIRPF